MHQPGFLHRRHSSNASFDDLASRQYAQYRLHTRIKLSSMSGGIEHHVKGMSAHGSSLGSLSLLMLR